MLVESDLTIPIVLWGKSPPKHCISCMYLTDNGKSLVTGCYDGQICTWDIEQDQISPKYIFIGHKCNILCMLNFSDNNIISSSEDGVLCVWDVADGFSSNTMKLPYVNTDMQLFKRSESNDVLLFCCGYYSDIIVLNPFTLEIMFTLHSIVNSNWVSCFHVQKSKQLNTDVVLGLTITGTIKLWVLKKEEPENELHYESESKRLSCPNAVALKYDNQQKYILIVCHDQWEIYDTNFFTLICTNKMEGNEKLLGGDFYSSEQIILWSDQGKSYVYQMEINENSQCRTTLCCTFESPNHSKIFTTVICFKSIENNQKYLVSGDAEGKICFWKSSTEDVTQVSENTSFSEFWNNASSLSILPYEHTKLSISVSIYVPHINKLIFGFFDGTIIIFEAVETILNQLFHEPGNDSDKYQVLLGHKGKVNCLLYPNQVYQNYDESFLVSGGSDFSICLWNVFTGTLIHKFCVHSGEITQLIVPPSNCKIRIQKCICSVASDHSVAVLSLTEKRCVILASNHMFPIISINWRPLDDFIIVECNDGSVYVWEMETGHLDRVLSGLNAQEVLSACQESCDDDTPNPLVQFFRGMKNKNVTEICYAAQRGLTQLQKFVFNQENSEIANPKNESLVIDDIKFGNSPVLGHILYFNIESIISELCILSKSEACSDLVHLNSLTDLKRLTQAQLFEISKTVAHAIEKIKMETESIQLKYQIKNIDDKPIQKETQDSKIEFITRVTQILLSFLHCWGLNPDIDAVCKEKLSLLIPVTAATTGIVCSKGNFSVCLPELKDSSPQNIRVLTYSPVVVVNYLCASTSLTNTLNMINDIPKPNSEKLSKEYWCCLLDNNKSLLESDTIRRPKIELLAQLYLNECLEIRNVVQGLLIKELELIGTEKRFQLLKFWYTYLPTGKTLVMNQNKNLDSNVIIYNYNKSELQILSLIIIGTIRINFTFEGHTQEQISLIDCISKHLTDVLSFILFHLTTKPYLISKLRKISIDLIGKGFPIWEKYFNVNKTLLSLFHASCNLDKFLPIRNPNLSTVFDITYTAHKAILEIANQRTRLFLNIITEEINNIKIHPNPVLTLEKSKAVILYIINELILKQRQTIVEFLVQVVDILLFCIDANHLKSKRISDLIPSLKTFTQIHHSVDLHKIAIGLKNGTIAIYELKHLKYNFITAHKELVDCVKFSPDGKTLCTYSYNENCLSFWQIFTTIFGFGNIQVKFLKSYNNCCVKSELDNDFGKIVWINNKMVTLMFQNGTEARFQL